SDVIKSSALNKERPVVVYCGENVRSPLAADTLMKMGHTNVKNYADGYLGWKQGGLPIAQ
ncbi:MAG: rhodanese-like domain-containing protein, partial [Cocleimonas sp.]|nr:rhodanese-like domain-containing protein [Cocleimonas sp.]